jgi:ribonuclease P protein component
VQNGGVRVTTPHFVLLLRGRAASAAGPGRLGITASKQVGNAVARNRSKRLVREAFRLDPGLLPEGIDLVVIVRAGTPELGLAQVRAEWAAVRGLVVKRAAALVRRGEIVR